MPALSPATKAPAGVLEIPFVAGGRGGNVLAGHNEFQAKGTSEARNEGRVGVRFAVIEPALFEHLQQWTNRKMKDEGWEFPT